MFYTGNFIAERTNTFNVETSILIPNTLVAPVQNRYLTVDTIDIDVVNGMSNVNVTTNTNFLTTRPDGLVELYDYIDRIILTEVTCNIYKDEFDILGVPFENNLIISDKYYLYDFDSLFNYVDDYYNKFYKIGRAHV